MEEKYARILLRGVATWNQWRVDNPEIRPDLRDMSFRTTSPSMLGVDLSKANFRGADMRGADLYRAWLVKTDFTGATLDFAIFGEATLGGARFVNAQLHEANFMKAHLYGADFTGSALSGAKFYGANLESAVLGQSLAGLWLEEANLQCASLVNADMQGARLRGANLQGADLRGAKLCNADLRGAQLIETKVEGADFSGAHVHGISVWSIIGAPLRQLGLVITSEEDHAAITVDDLDVAQFIHLLLTREKLRNIIDTVASKAVLILGRFSPGERKAVLDDLADEVRSHGLLPIIYDFEQSSERNLIEMIKVLAGLSLFVIVDITDPRSSPLELQATVPDFEIPFVPIVQENEQGFSMLRALERNRVLPLMTYSSSTILRKAFKKSILDPALAKHRELKMRKAQDMLTRRAEDFLTE